MTAREHKFHAQYSHSLFYKTFQNFSLPSHDQHNEGKRDIGKRKFSMKTTQSQYRKHMYQVLETKT